MSAGHGGQVLISLATEELVRDDLPENESPQDMGECRLKDLIRVERIHQLVLSGIPADFPPLVSSSGHSLFPVPSDDALVLCPCPHIPFGRDKRSVR